LHLASCAEPHRQIFQVGPFRPTPMRSTGSWPTVFRTCSKIPHIRQAHFLADDAVIAEVVDHIFTPSNAQNRPDKQRSFTESDLPSGTALTQAAAEADSKLNPTGGGFFWRWHIRKRCPSSRASMGVARHRGVRRVAAAWPFQNGAPYRSRDRGSGSCVRGDALLTLPRSPARWVRGCACHTPKLPRFARRRAS
jgi:hypothetical protein